MKIALITDAWAPQVNGVVRTLEQMCSALQQLGHIVEVIGPARYLTMPCPGYPEIRLSLLASLTIRRALRGADYDAVHIATEGPLGIAARRYCRRRNIAFTTACHTRLIEYIQMRLPRLPSRRAYRWLQRFHSAASATMVRSRSHRDELSARGFTNLKIWPGAVDTARFRPLGKAYWDLPRPVALYAGRVAIEKNLVEFLRLDLPGSKVIVGDGPDRQRLQKQFPEAIFCGYKYADDLVRAISAADVFVFPSKSDTFGLVMLEAMACGVPVAAYPVAGPRDVVDDGCNGALDNDLQQAVYRALRCAPEDCIERAGDFSIRRSVERFLSLLATSPEQSAAETAGDKYNPGTWPTLPTPIPATAATSIPPAS